MLNGCEDEHPDGERTWYNNGKCLPDAVNFIADERLKILTISFKEATE
jgi:hypothetical protein